MKIKSKLVIGFFLILALLVGITSFGYERLSNMNQSIDRFYGDRFEKVTAALEVREAINSTGRIINDILLGIEDPKIGVESYTVKLTSAARQFEALYKMNLTPEEQEHVDRIKQTADGYNKPIVQFFELAKQGKINDAKQLYTAGLHSAQQQVINSVDELVKYEEGVLKKEVDDARKHYNWSIRMVGLLTILGLVLGIAVVMWVFPSITKGLNLLGQMADRFGKGRLRGFSRYEVNSTDELGQLANVFKQIALDLQIKKEREAILSGLQQRQGRIDAQIARVTELLQQGNDIKLVAQAFISEFAPVLGASFGLLYLTDSSCTKDRQMELSGSYAVMGGNDIIESAPNRIRSGEGLLGQSIKDSRTILLNEVPQGYMKISSGLGESNPSSLIIKPIIHDHTVIGVLELASIYEFSSENIELLERLSEKLATIVNNIQSRQRVEELLRESQAMTEELQAQSEELICQQEELRDTNDKLEGQRNDLKNSELQLQQQQEELEHTNQELMIKTSSLQEYIKRMELQNSQIAKANAELERQALQLAMTTKYKSEFLANMSHELRTPLNSLLILSEFLAENKEGNLTDKQLEYMTTIHYSGNDLLKMIDEILDLSKVDAGKMDIHPEWMVLNDISTFLDTSQKGLTLSIESDADIPKVIWTDGHRLKQIIRNLMSNAFKFTNAGSISLTMRRPSEEEQLSQVWREDIPYIAFSVKDSGIGIASDKTNLIFEAFHQADGTTSRKYGGTGLGLTICKELARILGGWIHLTTEVGKGSVFTLVLPERIQEKSDQHEGMIELFTPKLIAAASEEENRPEDDRALKKLHKNEATFENKKILLVEDDVRNVFALSSVLEHRKMTVVYAENGKEALVKLEEEPDIDLVLMDIMMPEMDGYEAMKRIRENREWMNLPIIALTAKAMMDDKNKCIEAGASDYITKPVNINQLLSLMRVWLYR